MALNYIWSGFFLIAFLTALWHWLMGGDADIFHKIVEGTFKNAKTGFELSLGLTGVMALWLGLMRVGEKGGVIKGLAWLVGPFFRKLFPELPKDHPALGAILMNFSANMLGLDNAATPLGLKAMKEMQSLNEEKDRATDGQIMFLVLNTSGLTILPISVMVYRAQLGASDPADVFIPILLATFFSTLAGIFAVSYFQKIKLLDPIILAYLGGFMVFVVGLIWFFSGMPPEEVSRISAVASNFILLSVITLFITAGLFRKVDVYSTFIEGAKEGFKVAVTIIPFLVAMLVAIGMLRDSGFMQLVIDGVSAVVAALGMNTDFIPGLPTAFMKPLSGSGARGMMVETLQTYGVDSFAGQLASTLQGSTDTTLYVLAVYFGSVKIRKTRHALTCGLIADFVGIIAAVFIAYVFFH